MKHLGLLLYFTTLAYTSMGGVNGTKLRNYTVKPSSFGRSY